MPAITDFTRDLLILAWREARSSQAETYEAYTTAADAHRAGKIASKDFIEARKALDLSNDLCDRLDAMIALLPEGDDLQIRSAALKAPVFGG